MNVIRFQDLCIQGKVAGKRVFIRADLNVPQDASGAITEDTRIRASIPCTRMALEAGAAVMLTSHLGRPTEGQLRPEDSLAPVAQRLSELLGRPVPLLTDWIKGVAVRRGDALAQVRFSRGDARLGPEDLDALQARDPAVGWSDGRPAPLLAPCCFAPLR